MDRPALDSLAHVLDMLRRDSTQLIVTLGYPSTLIPLPGPHLQRHAAPRSHRARRARLRPDILVPGAGSVRRRHARRGRTRAAVLGELPHARRRDRQARRPRTAHRRRRRRRTTGATARSTRGPRRADSPVDVVGFTLFPSRTGVRTLDAARGAADRWMRESQLHEGPLGLRRRRLSPKRTAKRARSARCGPHSPGRRAAADQGTHRRARRATTARSRGLRAPDGHLRRATFAVMRRCGD